MVQDWFEGWEKKGEKMRLIEENRKDVSPFCEEAEQFCHAYMMSGIVACGKCEERKGV